jgi:hypothetical protein
MTITEKCDWYYSEKLTTFEADRLHFFIICTVCFYIVMIDVLILKSLLLHHIKQY